MEKCRIDFQVKSLDTSNYFTTDGEIGNNRIKFTDNENNMNYIIFYKESIEYYKKGTTNMKYKFDNQKTTKGEYTLSGYNFVFDIKTKKIHHENNELVIEFDLYQDKEKVNTTTIDLKYTFLKEEQL